MINYVNSELWRNIEYCNDIEQLYCMARYIEGAAGYHKIHGDQENYEFFKSANEHWKTKISFKIREANTK